MLKIISEGRTLKRKEVENVDEEKVKEIETLFFEKRVIGITGEINQKEADRLLAQLLALNCQDDTAPVTFYIRSGGGSSLASLDIFDALCCSSAPVNGVVAGMAYSAAATILQGCKYSGRGDIKGKRIMLPNSRLLIHYGIHYEFRMDPLENNMLKSNYEE